jgi:hypothetical protein
LTGKNNKKKNQESGNSHRMIVREIKLSDKPEK